VFERVRCAVDALKATARALDPLCVDGSDAAALFELVSEGERVCGAMKALMARRVDETGVWRKDGHRSAAHWVADATGATVGAATRTLETARALDHLRAGAEGDDRTWARRLHKERRAHDWTDPDGAYRIEARLAPDAGARFRSAWTAHIDRIFRDARRAGRREPRAAYAADALVALATQGPCKPVELHVTVDSAALARGHTTAGERCAIRGVGPVPVATARALLDDARVSVLVRDGDDVTAVSSPKRTIPTKVRRALEARFPACGVKACANDQFLEIDHVVPLEDHGRTELDNLWRICTHHHALKTYGGWRVTGRNGDRDLVPP
jgi:hypothetical protein